MKIELRKIKFEDVKKVYEFLSRFPLDYPNYSKWLKKCRKELEGGNKEGFYAAEKNNIIGSVIFQRHKQNPSILEIKNFRVSIEYPKKGIGSKLYKSIEEYAKALGFPKIQVDTHSENKDIIKLFEKQGFQIKSKEPIYFPDKPEVILSKEI